MAYVLKLRPKEMKYKKMVDRDALDPEELEALDSGEKTEEDLLKEWEEKEAQEREEEKKKILDEAEKAKELANNYKIRAEKAEKAEKKEPKDNAPKNGLSQTDIITLARADIHDDDIDEVLEYARFKKIGVKEALNSGVIKSFLAERKEERATAEATTTGNKRPGGKAITGNELLAQVEGGKYPESDEDIEKLVDARFKSKRK